MFWNSQWHMGEGYICNNAAYGPTKEHFADNAHWFWTGSGVLHDKLWQQNLSFTELVYFVKDAKDEKGGKFFPSFGILASYLLVADLAYAQCAPMPTINEMGSMVWTLQKGARNGLEKLGYPVKLEIEVASSFKKVYHFLDQDKDFSRIKLGCAFDGIMLEHSLCKLSWDKVLERVYNKKNLVQTR
ncbi:hypothetical protein GYMLUDRAFT_59403 [Collybiopsis luxurians FD-317 M1]|uniref:Uncharacterized protein n=1 Tax=Collybiopsis luxurians FD-317 M1 TaxID=944289 RepID=A0A0D0CWZ7_9AGAR|nr:hypothetical protein GYMLUDRAFT_59403 [Collybiopsis luxurians FD-317 M1]